ncbi:YjfB family protein [Halobacillus sp. SY10]|uniref:Putative motility protein n=1 Tax=Halobacillus aidingensis TaxID=240303 RepID=A0A1H0L084_HALAD|nr:YjfB family protein [Halobacillus aidingensis]SDO61453.1 Putative motility protein [Halobacillus aidingensis]
MDIAAISMAMSTTSLKQQSSLALMDKVKGDAEEKGNQMVEMLNQSAPHPDLGNRIDLKG